MPARAELPGRLHTVLQVIYLVFNEGYATSSGEWLTAPISQLRPSAWGGCWWNLLPEPEAQGLLALMLLHESRRAAALRPAAI